MLERLLNFFLAEPHRLTILGAALARAGGFFLIAGLVGQVATTAASTVQGLAHIRPATASLSDVLPEYLSTWMPESALGFSLVALMLALGLWTVRVGRAYERQLGT